METRTRLFVVIALTSMLFACVPPSRSVTFVTPTSLARVPVATSMPMSIEAPTSTTTAIAALTKTPATTSIVKPTSPGTPTPELVHPPVESPVKFDAKGVLYEDLEGSPAQRVQPLTGDGHVNQIAFNGDGAAWFFTDHGVGCLANGRIMYFDNERAAIAAAFPWTGAQTLWPVAPDGTLWTVDSHNLLGYNGKTWLNIPLDGDAVETVDHVAAGPNGLLAVTSASGLSVYTPETGWQMPPLPKGISRDLWIKNDLLTALDGSLWIGLGVFGTGGLLQYVPVSRTWTVFNGGHGDLPQISVTGLALNASGDLWVSNDTHGILAVRRATSGTWDYLTHVSPFPDIYGFGKAYFGIGGDLWLPTIGHCGEEGDPCWLGLAHYANGTWQRYTVANGLTSDHVFAVAVDLSGTPWLVTDKGLQRFQP